MIRTPRASLTIAILDDEDFRLLAEMRGGMEAFGFFVAVLIAGRERLGRGRARQIAGTDSLRFDDSTTHVLRMIYSGPKQLEKCLAAFKEVADATRSKPWLYKDKEDRLVIKSFFKFNTNAGWGGTRDGAGRKSRGNQDDSEANQLDSNLQSSCSATGACAVTVTVTDSCVCPDESPDTDTHTDPSEITEEQPPPPDIAPGRSPQDRADLEAAIQTLTADLRTYNVGVDLGRQHNGRKLAGIEGWRWRIAAEKLQGPGIKPDQMESLPYLTAIARNADPNERVSVRPKPRDSPPASQHRPSTTSTLDPRIVEAAKRDTLALQGRKGST